MIAVRRSGRLWLGVRCGLGFRDFQRNGNLFPRRKTFVSRFEFRSRLTLVGETCGPSSRDGE